MLAPESSALSISRKERRDKKEAKRIQLRLEWLALRHMDGRNHPVDAVTLEPVQLDKPRNDRRKRLFGLARRYRNTRSMRFGEMIYASASLGDDVGKTIVGTERIAEWRREAELERQRRTVPTEWTAELVDEWMMVAYETLYRLPMKIWPVAYGSCMPVPSEYRDIDWADEVARAGNAELEEPPPLFGIARLRMLGVPEKYEIDRMNVALQWTSQYLLSEPLLSQCVGYGALWKALDITFTEKGMRKMCRRKFNCKPEEFDEARALGLKTIAGGLNAAASGQAR